MATQKTIGKKTTLKAIPEQAAKSIPPTPQEPPKWEWQADAIIDVLGIDWEAIYNSGRGLYTAAQRGEITFTANELNGYVAINNLIMALERTFSKAVEKGTIVQK